MILFFLLPLFLFGQEIHVLMPVYNSSEHLEKSISSVFRQSYKKVHLITYDDGSSDDSPAILSHYSTLYPEKITIFRGEENRGIAFARKSLLKHSFEMDPDAFILWLDSDDQFVDLTFFQQFVDQMERTGADICLFNFSLILEEESQAKNLNGLYSEKRGYETVLDAIYSSREGVLAPEEIEGLEQVTTLGWVKGYRKIKWPEPLDCPYEDFVYMAALFEADKITALPSSLEPIEYLRRSNSITGRRTEKTFFSVLAQLERFLLEISPEKRALHKEKIDALVKRKIAQYETLLEGLIGREDLTSDTLNEYRIKSAKLRNSG